MPHSTNNPFAHLPLDFQLKQASVSTGRTVREDDTMEQAQWRRRRHGYAGIWRLQSGARIAIHQSIQFKYTFNDMG